MINWEFQKCLFVYDWTGPAAYQSFAPLADLPYSLFFDSNRPSHPLSRYSYLCWHPFETIECKDGRVTITNAENQFTYMADVFQVLRERLALWSENVKGGPGLYPFEGGAAGFFGYDLGRGLEKIPAGTSSNTLPDLCIGLYDKVLAFDHETGKAHLIIYALNEKLAMASKTWLEETVLLQSSKVAPYMPMNIQWSTQRDDSSYKNDIQKVIDYIYAGDIFQANLSRRFMAAIPDDFHPYAHYGHLRNINAAPYGAFMNFGDLKLASCSPERFLSVKARQVETRPIKGTLSSTRPAKELLESEKDRAENAMIVDLLRNDLSKVCEDHSVVVDRLFDIETFEGLHHMVSVVSGVLRGDQSPADLLRACFPGGSITGAPKIRSMQIIEELEPERRGPYCGAMGYIGFNGTMDTSISIRTLVYHGNSISIQSGGGIVSDSVPELELQESLTKARKLFESFENIAEARKIA